MSYSREFTTEEIIVFLRQLSDDEAECENLLDMHDESDNEKKSSTL